MNALLRRLFIRAERLEDRNQPSFLGPRSYDAGEGLRSLAAADLDGDRTLDLVTTNGLVSIQFGNGDGSFQPRHILGGLPLVFDAAIADLNGDGQPDLALVIDIGLGILLGNGDGTFGGLTSYRLDGNGGIVTVADFNADGGFDVVAGQFGRVSILLGNGDGTFQGPQVFRTDSFTTTSLNAADLNADGSMDLVTTQGDQSPLGRGSTSVLLGRGDGSFASAVNYRFGFELPVHADVGDLDGDGTLDVVAAQASGRVLWLPGRGDGSLAVPTILGFLGSHVRLIDLTGDKVLDVLIITGSAVNFHAGNGDGTFLAPQTFGAGAGPRSFLVQDFNGDGLADLAVANPFSGNVSVLLGQGVADFERAPGTVAGGLPYDVAVADFNLDGILDLATPNFVASRASILLGNGDGTFQAPFSYATGFRPSYLAVGDFNQDGAPDLAVVNEGGSLTVLLGTGDGTFVAAPTVPLPQRSGDIVAGDFNGDGNTDLAVAQEASSTVHVLLSRGDGTFEPARVIAAVARAPAVAAADLNGDGALDLVTAGSGGIGVTLGNGDGTFGPLRRFAGGDFNAAVALGDWNGDGNVDAAAGEARGNFVYLFLGQGDGAFGPPQAMPLGGRVPRSLVADDFNGDGLLDLAPVHDGSVRLLLGNGDGTFQVTHVSHLAGPIPLGAASGDLDGNGLPDLAVASFGADLVSLLFSVPDTQPSPGSGPSFDDIERLLMRRPVWQFDEPLEWDDPR